ncbi:MAG: hypothetical protein H7X80_08490 [bacterium]|nr:hypothetical protein [Candidatus Kapabacteria bacterium]
MEITKSHIAAVITNYVSTFVEANGAASILQKQLAAAGVGLRPVIDHISFRTMQVHERALEFEALGYSYDDSIGVVERDDFWYKVYRKPGLPAVLIQQAHEDARGTRSPIPAWVQRFTDGLPHHIAIEVDRMEDAVEALTKAGITFVGKIVGDKASEFRQIYAQPEIIDGVPATVLELVERRWGFTGHLSLNSPETVMSRLASTP